MTQVRGMQTRAYACPVKEASCALLYGYTVPRNISEEQKMNFFNKKRSEDDFFFQKRIDQKMSTQTIVREAPSPAPDEQRQYETPLTQEPTQAHKFLITSL
jgi:hypothetical protein